jgi:hypothetical protein
MIGFIGIFSAAELTKKGGASSKLPPSLIMLISDYTTSRFKNGEGSYACFALNLLFILLITRTLPFLFTIRQFLSLAFKDFSDLTTFIINSFFGLIIICIVNELENTPISISLTMWFAL